MMSLATSRAQIKAKKRMTTAGTREEGIAKGTLTLSGRIPELDGIRGLAITSVLAYHYFFLAFRFRPGSLPAYFLATGRLAWSGVDLFFVLSGFLIGGILLDARHSFNYFKVFYTRRFLRIVPIYVVCLAATLGLTSLAHLDPSRRFTWMWADQLPWTPYLIFLQNFWMAHRNTLGLFGLTVTWSLAVEEQFYLSLPLVIRILSPRALIGALMAGILTAPILRIILHALWPEHIYSWVLMMPCRADALLLGVFGAITMRDQEWRARLQRNRRVMRLALALLACGFICLTLRSSSPYSLGILTFGFTWLAAFYLTILLYSLTFRDGWISKCLRWKWLGWLGSIAYGTYLFHQLIQAAFFGLFRSRPPSILSFQDFLLSILALAFTLTLCHLSWVYFEKPLVKLGHALRYEMDAKSDPEALVGLMPERRRT